MQKLDGYTTFGLVAYSLGAHLAVVLVATTFGRVPAAAASPRPDPVDLTFVELAPQQAPSPAAVSPGAPGPRGASAREAAPRSAAPARPALPSPVDAAPAGVLPVASAALPSGASDLGDAVRRAMLAPAASGAPQGPGGGGGEGGAGLGSYKAVLAGWLQARVAGGGGAADEPHEALRVTARVTLSPERAITGFSIVSPSGHAAFDARIEGRLRALSSSGATLPPPPDGVDPPPAITVAFTCKPNERCA